MFCLLCTYSPKNEWGVGTPIVSPWGRCSWWCCSECWRCVGGCVGSLTLLKRDRTSYSSLYTMSFPPSFVRFKWECAIESVLRTDNRDPACAVTASEVTTSCMTQKWHSIYTVGHKNVSLYFRRLLWHILSDCYALNYHCGKVICSWKRPRPTASWDAFDRTDYSQFCKMWSNVTKFVFSSSYWGIFYQHPGKRIFFSFSEVSDQNFIVSAQHFLSDVQCESVMTSSGHEVEYLFLRNK